jgi:ribosomal protein L9
VRLEYLLLRESVPSSTDENLKNWEKRRKRRAKRKIQNSNEIERLRNESGNKARQPATEVFKHCTGPKDHYRFFSQYFCH